MTPSYQTYLMYWVLHSRQHLSSSHSINYINCKPFVGPISIHFQTIAFNSSYLILGPHMKKMQQSLPLIWQCHLWGPAFASNTHPPFSPLLPCESFWWSIVDHVKNVKITVTSHSSPFPVVSWFRAYMILLSWCLIDSLHRNRWHEEAHSILGGVPSRCSLLALDRVRRTTAESR